ncbi:MAG: hypothetical protein LBM93_05915 [Oscillospiraceae bacterium]|nr:hypothetical protein [Oscillospiraceae bacterium]
MKIIVDIDGFFSQDDISKYYNEDNRRVLGFDYEEQDDNSLLEQFYLGLRSSSIFIADKNDNLNEVKDKIRKFCTLYLREAHNYVARHKSKGNLPADFMWIIREVIKSTLNSEQSNIENVNFRLSMKPRLSARVFDSNTIVIPALSRTILLQCNLALTNSAYNAIEESGELNGKVNIFEIENYLNVSRLARNLLPCLIFCHDDIPVNNLPLFSGYTEDSVKTALAFTNLQMMFITAHEYAHIVLKHFINDDPKNPGFDKEYEADDFALNTLLNYINKTELFSADDVFTSIRWLFKFMLLEEMIGILIQGNSIKNYESLIEKRCARLQSRIINEHYVKTNTLLDIYGIFEIVAIENELKGQGVSITKELLECIEKSKITKEMEPWWEKIAKA